MPAFGGYRLTRALRALPAVATRVYEPYLAQLVGRSRVVQVQIGHRVHRGGTFGAVVAALGAEVTGERMVLPVRGWQVEELAVVDRVRLQRHGGSPWWVGRDICAR